jgi:hypothetical protein
MEAFVSTKLRSITIRVPPELLHDVECLAAADRRPVAQKLRLMIQDAVEASRCTDAGVAHAAA